MKYKALGVCIAVLQLLLISSAAQAEEATWKSPFLESVRVAPHLEPALLHPAWDKEAQEKLVGPNKRGTRVLSCAHTSYHIP